MQSGLDLFFWRYPAGGFEWVNAKVLPVLQRSDKLDRAESRFLVAKPMEAPAYTRYNPLVTEPLLFRKFVDTESSEEGFLSFANQFGDLGVGLLIVRDDQGTPGVVSTGFSTHDPLYRWYAAHASMGAIVDVLTAIQQRDIPTLRKWFEVGDGAARYSRNEEKRTASWSTVTIANQHREYLWDWAMAAETEDEALLRIAQGWAQHEVNSAVSSDDGETTSTVRVVFDADAGKMAMRICPTSLLAAMWLQCARVLTLNPSFKECEHCGNWFELSPDAKRRQAKYCSSRCKVAAYRAKKAAGSATGYKLR